jgi:PAS domain S-box-containing protein
MIKLVLETALDAVIVMRSDGIVADWNAQAETVFGWTPSEAIGFEMASLIIPGQYRELHRQGLSRYLATGEGPVLRKRIEITAVCKSGEEFPIELSITPVDRDGQQVFLGFIRDITERRMTERRLKRQANEARLLHELTSLAADSSSLNTVLEICLKSVRELLGWPIGHAYLVGAPEQENLIGSIWSGDIEAFPVLRNRTEGTIFSRGVGLPGNVWQDRKPIWISDVQQDKRYLRAKSGDLEIRSAFGLPIITSGEVVAVLEFFGVPPTAPDESLILTARAMGDQIGRVLERQRVQEQQGLLLAELEHRSKNMLAVVMGIASQTAKTAPSVEAFTKEYLGRLASLSRAYSLLTEKNWEAATLGSLVAEVIGPHLSSMDEQLELQGGEIVFPAKTALTISMILHELTTNAAKYGALRSGGKIHILANAVPAPDGVAIQLVWQETGVPDAVAPARSGFGSKLIETSIRHELRGGMQVSRGRDGIRYEFDFALSRAGAKLQPT